MSLDQSLFTLVLTPNTSHPAGSVVDLTDPEGTIHYRKRRIVSQQQQVYRIELSDPLSEVLLASATAPSATSKHKTVELYNPSKVVELKYTGTLTFRWSFKWETHEFEWRREECFIIRKPDPPVLVAVTKEPPGRIRTSSIQILDYNLNRFDIEDRKGLEIVLLTALLTFQDASDTYHEPSPTTTPTVTLPTSTSLASNVPSVMAPPKPPPKPAPKKGVERIAELQLGRGQVNEVTVLEEGAVADYAKHCAKLLQDDAMLFISVRSSDPDQVPKVLQVVEETKRLRYKAGDPDLHQYVLYDTKEQTTLQKGPRIIKLDDDGKNKGKEYTPPQSLSVHLSKIDMPELRPRGAPVNRHHTARRDNDSGRKKEKEPSKRVKEKGRDKDKDKGERKGKGGQSKHAAAAAKQSTSPPRPNALHKYYSQYFQPPPPTQPPFGSRPSLTARPSSSYYHAPTLPPRTNVPQNPSGTLRRQSMYAPLYGDQYMYPYEHAGTANGMHPDGNISSIPGLLGKFLGR